MNSKKKLLIVGIVVLLLVVVVKVNNHIDTYHLEGENITEYVKRRFRRDIDSDYFKHLDAYEDDRYRIETYRLSEKMYGCYIFEQDFRGKYKSNGYSMGYGYFTKLSYPRGERYDFYVIGNNKFDETIIMKLQAGDEVIRRKFEPGYFIIRLNIDEEHISTIEDFTFLNERNEDVTRSIIYE